jgi:tripartite-type tricarboxylate transporter receptor subunit TctC
MRPTGGRRLVLLLLAVIGSVQSAAATADDRRPISFLVGSRPGGSADTMARMLSRNLSESFHRPVLVINVAGAGTSIAAARVAAAAPDGNTFGLTLAAAHTYDPHTGFVPYGFDDFAYVGAIAQFVPVLAARADAPFHTFPELLGYARRQGAATYASLMPLDRVLLQEVGRRAGANLIPVPGNGGAGIRWALYGSHVDFAFFAGDYQEDVTAGKLRLLACMGERRPPDFPGVPTLTELGYPLTMLNAVVIVAPRRTPDDVVQRMSRELRAAVAAPEFQDLIRSRLRILPLNWGPEQVTRELRSQYEAFRVGAVH